MAKEVIREYEAYGYQVRIYKTALSEAEREKENARLLEKIEASLRQYESD